MIINQEKLEINSEEEFDSIKLLKLTKEQEGIINPQIPHTSGIRMEIMDKTEEEEYKIPVDKMHMFLRVFKSVAEVSKEEIKKKNPNVLIVSDDRPSSDILMEYCSKIFTFHDYNIYFQKAYDEKNLKLSENCPYLSRMGTPYASCSLALYDELDLVVVLTASHNSIIWNGIKVYLDLAFPISGRVMEAISQRAISLQKLELSKSINPIYIDADKQNNDYIEKVIEKLIDVSELKDKKIIFWPFLGNAPEIQMLLKNFNVDLITIDEDIDPPNPTDEFDRNKVEALMEKENANIAILMDADRDRIVFLVKDIKEKQALKYISLTPNELYTAMHNILSNEFSKKFINVRTIPSDPRSDNSAKLNIITGVGYKHLGMVIFSSIGKKIDDETIQTGILYVKTEDGYKKIKNSHEIREIIKNSSVRGEDIIMVLWEESGGHTFNILSIHDDSEQKDGIKITPVVPANGDKYPAIAILILCGLIEKGYDLRDFLDTNIIGTRTEIEANDNMKVEIVRYFAEKEGEKYNVDDYSYNIGTFEEINGTVAVIFLKSQDTEIYIRPSGTGPSVRIYAYAPQKSAVQQMELVKEKILKHFS